MIIADEMKNEKEIRDLESGMEDILSPKCSFHTSPGFKEKVMAEARALSQPQPKSRKSRWLAIGAAYAAASVALALIITLFISRDAGRTHTDAVTADGYVHKAKSYKKVNADPAEVCAIVTPSTPGPKKEVSGPTPRRHRKRLPLTPDTPQPVVTDPDPQTETVIEGAMRTESVISDSLPDPVKIRKRLIESRRREEIAYIEKTRDEIQAYEAVIMQLMTSDNVNN